MIIFRSIKIRILYVFCGKFAVSMIWIKEGFGIFILAFHIFYSSHIADFDGLVNYSFGTDIPTLSCSSCMFGLLLVLASASLVLKFFNILWISKPCVEVF